MYFHYLNPTTSNMAISKLLVLHSGSFSKVSQVNVAPSIRFDLIERPSRELKKTSLKNKHSYNASKMHYKCITLRR